jgi:hypothetical protein
MNTHLTGTLVVCLMTLKSNFNLHVLLFFELSNGKVPSSSIFTHSLIFKLSDVKVYITLFHTPIYLTTYESLLI